eukprot:11216485-Lingulodinium_polyedra.AAC.1
MACGVTPRCVSLHRGARPRATERVDARNVVQQSAMFRRRAQCCVTARNGVPYCTRACNVGAR